MLEVKNLVKRYGEKTAVNNISFKLEKGEIFGFIGHNGAGKTTTIKAICGIHDFDSGEIFIDGINLKKDPISCKSVMAYLSDNPELYENMKAIDFINFVCDMYGTSQKIREKNIKKYAEMFEIENKLNDPINSYSHGMKQKLALISALAHEPKLLIMDEPFVGLDPKAVFDMKEIMKEMCKDGKTIMFSTHILDVAEKLCDRIAIIKNGELVACGKMNEVKGNKSLESVFLELGEK